MTLESHTIGNSCYVGDGTHSKIEREDSGVLYLTCRNFKDGRVDYSKVYYISEMNFTKYFKSGKKALICPQPGDLVFSIIGTIGEPYLVRHNDRFGISSSVAIVRSKQNIDPKFLYYWMRGSKFQSALFATKGGVAQGYVSLEMIKSLPVPSLTLTTQRKIAGILSAYDDLIENNLRRIKILEQMTQSLYREWFVHFRFPGHESAKVKDSELGRIPEGWEVSDLESLTTKIGSGATPRGGKDSYQESGITLIRSMNIYDYRFEFDNLAFIDSKQAAQLDNVSIEERDVLLNITGASVCRCAMVPSDLLPARVNQHVAIIRADTEAADPYFLLDSINSEQNKRTLFGLAQGGATREALTKESICRFQILQPTLDLIKHYGRIAGAIHTQRETLQRKNQTLRCTRDLLLPKLLSPQTSSN